jgi:hypothetical protein
MKNKGLIILAIIAIGLGLYLAFSKKIKAWIVTQKEKLKAEFASNNNINSNVPADYAGTQTNTNTGGNTGTVKAPAGTAGTGLFNDQKILKKGMPKCDEVEALQNLLNNYVMKVMLNPLTADGSFGTKTQIALSKICNKTFCSLAEARVICGQLYPTIQLPDGLGFLNK